MKKIVCLCMTAILALGLCISPIYAAEPSPQYEIVDQREENGFITTELKIGQSLDFDIHILAFNYGVDPYWYERIGAYTFRVDSSQLDIYAVKNGTKIPIKDAYEQNLINLDEVAKLVDGFHYDAIWYDTYPIGDADQNKILNMKDILIMQKHLARIDNMELDFFYMLAVIDYNKNWRLDVADIIAAQKFLAKIPVVLP